jgi:hypothetical protein
LSRPEQTHTRHVTPTSDNRDPITRFTPSVINEVEGTFNETEASAASITWANQDETGEKARRAQATWATDMQIGQDDGSP